MGLLRDRTVPKSELCVIHINVSAQGEQRLIVHLHWDKMSQKALFSLFNILLSLE